MSLSLFDKITLGIAGTTALGVGGFILAAPHLFFASYGITLGDNASLLSELRAPGAGLAAFGILMLAGIRSPALSTMSVATALTVFLAFPAGRLLGLAIDGIPSDGIIGALVFELAVGALCVVAFKRRLGFARPGLRSAE